MKKNLLIIVLISILTGCVKNAEPETFLIPEDYSGGVIVIIFNQKNGSVKEYDEGRRIYRIPKNGILHTQFSPVEGVLNEKFFWVDKKYNLINEIRRVVFENEPRKEVTYILDQYDGSFTIYPKRGILEGSSKDYPSIDYIYITLGKINQDRNDLRKKANKVIQELSERY